MNGVGLHSIRAAQRGRQGKKGAKQIGGAIYKDKGFLGVFI